MNRKKYVYIGEPIPELNGSDCAPFILHLQIGLLLSLQERGLLTASQCDRCKRALAQESAKQEKREKERQA